jgi:hypothetical protein
MDQKVMLKQMLDFCQASFNNAYSANAMLQDQFERVANTVLDQATWLPPDGRKAIQDWVAAYKTGRDNYKKFVDDSYKKVEEFFAG